MAERIDDIVAGTTVTYTLTFDIADTVIDITGYTGWFTMKTNYDDDDDDADLQKIFSLTDPTNGVATVTLTAVETAALDKKPYYYDFKYKTAGGACHKIPMDSDRVSVIYTSTQRTS